MFIVWTHESVLDLSGMDCVDGDDDDEEASDAGCVSRIA